VVVSRVPLSIFHSIFDALELSLRLCELSVSD
jgi:hypothetical protein